MDQLIYTVIGGIIVAIIVAIFEIGGTRRVVVQGSPIKKTGKKIMIFSIIMILGGLYWAQQTSTTNSGIDFGQPGTIVALYGLIIFFVGRAVAWFQRN